MNESNPIGRMADALEKDIKARSDFLDELKEGTEQLRTLNQRLAYIMGGLVLFGGSTLSVGIAQNKNIEDLPKEIPRVRIQPIPQEKVPQ